MYKARHQPSGDEIIILDPRWMAQLEFLRRLDKQDALVCPGCEQPVRVRAGKIKRWHFAHKHLENCPFERQSPELLKTRAVLYEWLVEKFGEDAVTLERMVAESTIPRPVDCWVEIDDHTFAYWIFDRRLPPDERNNLKSGFGEIGVDAQWVFVVDLLRVDELTPKSRLHLTTTERAFLRQSELDKAWQTHFEHLGSTLHYLDPDQGTLTTYRNLNLVHEPQLYSGKQLQHPLAAVLVANQTGEFVHPGELEQLQQRQGEIEHQRQKAEERLQKGQDFFKGISTPIQSPAPQESQAPVEKIGTCKFCGTVTADWVTYFGQTKECICRNCKDRV